MNERSSSDPNSGRQKRNKKKNSLPLLPTPPTAIDAPPEAYCDALMARTHDPQIRQARASGQSARRQQTPAKCCSSAFIALSKRRDELSFLIIAVEGDRGCRQKNTTAGENATAVAKKRKDELIGIVDGRR